MERNCEACKNYVTSEDGKTKSCSRWECKYDERMTNEEAIRVLENYKPKVKRATLAAKRAKEAFDMAISALSVPEREKGTWLEHYDCFSCSCCHTEFDILEGTPKDNEYNFCPKCGADMRGKSE